MKSFLFCFFFFHLPLSFSIGNSENVKFKNISFEEFKIENNYKLVINNVFKKQRRETLFEGTAVSELINKFSNTNHLSLKIKRANNKENELKISFSKSSLALKFMLD